MFIKKRRLLKHFSKIYLDVLDDFSTITIANYYIKSDLMNEKSVFYSFGIWNKDGKVKFFIQDEQNASNSGSSITNLFKNSKYDLLDCYKLLMLM